jgi:dipeptidyl aminopeptidase/acylaminoacyl peptidase
MSTSRPLSTTPLPARRVRRRGIPRLLWRSAAIVVALALALAYAAPSAVVADRLTRPRHLPTTTDPQALGLAVEPVAFPSRGDHVTRHGWLLPADRPPADRPPPLIIVVHGIYGVRDDPTIGLLPIAAGLVAAGSDVLLFDLRGHGASDGDRTSLGWHERRDLHGALDWAAARGYDRVGVQGYSMGAATAVLTAAEDGRVTALAIDGGFADLASVLEAEVPRRSGLPPAYTPGVLAMMRLLSGADVAAIRPVEAMAHLRDRPVLILHGADDQRIPVGHAEALWAARSGGESDGSRVMLRVFPGAGHVTSYQSDPEAYLATIRAFWATALPADAPDTGLAPAGVVLSAVPAGGAGRRDDQTGEYGVALHLFSHHRLPRSARPR